MEKMKSEVKALSGQDLYFTGFVRIAC